MLEKIKTVALTATYAYVAVYSVKGLCDLTHDAAVEIKHQINKRK